MLTTIAFQTFESGSAVPPVAGTHESSLGGWSFPYSLRKPGRYGHESWNTGLDWTEYHAPKVVYCRFKWGGDTVFVPLAIGKKCPTSDCKGYLGFTLEKLADESYLRLLQEQDIAILNGPNSGHLISIDLDTEQAAAEFFEANPALRDCRRTWAHNPGNIWVRMTGAYPVGVFEIKNDHGDHLGELRTGKCITKVCGTHPKGTWYQTSAGRILEGPFSALNWPPKWTRSWESESVVSNQFEEIVRRQGQPFDTNNGRLRINEPFFVEVLAAENRLLFTPSLGFLAYNSGTGTWLPMASPEIDELFSRLLKRIADDAVMDELAFKRNRTLLSSLRSQLKGNVFNSQAFTSPPAAIHAGNGMLEISSGGIKMQQFHPDFFSLSQCPFNYRLDAKCVIYRRH